MIHGVCCGMAGIAAAAEAGLSYVEPDTATRSLTKCVKRRLPRALRSRASTAFSAAR